MAQSFEVGYTISYKSSISQWYITLVHCWTHVWRMDGKSKIVTLLMIDNGIVVIPLKGNNINMFYACSTNEEWNCK